MAALEITDTETESWIAEQLQCDEQLRQTGDLECSLNASSHSRSRSPLRSREAGKMHLVLGDSIARRAQFKPTDHADEVFDRSRGGATWLSVLQKLQSEINDWITATQAFGMDRGYCVLWLRGNDAYGRVAGLPNKEQTHLFDVGKSPNR